MQIKQDKEFMELLPPLSNEEFGQLKNNILVDGCREPLVLWQGLIVDGNNRYKICTENGITFQTTEKQFTSREDAIIWICKNQTGRRNITDEQKTYLLGKQYEATKKLVGYNTGLRDDQGRFIQRDQNEPSGASRTAVHVAEEMGVGHMTVKRAEQFAKGLDAIGEAAPELKAEILSGRTSATKQDVRAVAKLPEPERPAAIEKLRRGEKVKLPQNIGLPSSVAPVTTSDIARSIERTFREFADTVDNLINVHRDLIDLDPQNIVSVFEDYIKILNEMKEGLT